MTLHIRRCLARWHAFSVVAMALTVSLRAETGYDLWLRYVPLADAPERAAYRRSATAIVVESQSPTSAAIVSELQRGLQGLLDVNAARVDRPQSDGAVIVGTPSSSPLVAALGWTDALVRAGHEGYVIRSASVAGHSPFVAAYSRIASMQRSAARRSVRRPRRRSSSRQRSSMQFRPSRRSGSFRRARRRR